MRRRAKCPRSRALFARARVILAVMPHIAGARRVTTALFSTVRDRPVLFEVFFVAFRFCFQTMRCASLTAVQAPAMATVRSAFSIRSAFSLCREFSLVLAPFSARVGRSADCGGGVHVRWRVEGSGSMRRCCPRSSLQFHLHRPRQLKHGAGTLRFSDGTVHTGEFANDL